MFALLVAASADVPPSRFECDEDTVSVINAGDDHARLLGRDRGALELPSASSASRPPDAAALTAQLYQRYLGEDVLEGLMGSVHCEFWMPRAAASPSGSAASRNASASRGRRACRRAPRRRRACAPRATSAACARAGRSGRSTAGSTAR